MTKAHTCIRFAAVLAFILFACTTHADETTPSREQEARQALNQAIADEPQAIPDRLYSYYQILLEVNGIETVKKNGVSNPRGLREALATVDGETWQCLEALKEDPHDPAAVLAVMTWQMALPPDRRDVNWLVNQFALPAADVIGQYDFIYVLRDCPLAGAYCENILRRLEQLVAMHGYAKKSRYEWCNIALMLADKQLDPWQQARLKQLLLPALASFTEEEKVKEDGVRILEAAGGNAIAWMTGIVQLSPTPDDLTAIEDAWLCFEEAKSIPVNEGSCILSGLPQFVYALSCHAPESGIFALLKQQLRDALDSGDPSKYQEEYTPPIPVDALSPFEFAPHIVMVEYSVDRHASFWRGLRDAEKFDKPDEMMTRILRERREDAFQYWLRCLKFNGNKRAAMALGFCKDRWALDSLKYWLLHAEGESAEHAWYMSMDGTQSYLCPSHIAYVKAIEYITDQPLEEAVRLTEEEIGMLVKRLHRPIPMERAPSSDIDWRIDVSLLCTFAPELGFQECSRLFRENGPNQRFMWDHLMPSLLRDNVPAGAPVADIIAVLGEPDARMDAANVTLPTFRHTESEARKALKSLACTAILKWETDVPTTGEERYWRSPDPLLVLVNGDAFITAVCRLEDAWDKR